MADSYLPVNRLNSNTSAFIALLQAGLWEKKVRLDAFEGVNYGEIYRLAEKQSVLGVVLAGIDHLPKEQRPPSELLLKWIGTVQIIEQKNKEMNRFIGYLVNKLRNADIYALLVKGQGIAQCYEHPLWRTCGDVDLFSK